MNSVILITDGVVQVVLTPENEHEKAVVNILKDKKADVSIHKGSFYECQGGWVRESKDTDSLFLTVKLVGGR